MTDRPTRDCHHPGAPHKHGTLLASGHTTTQICERLNVLEYSTVAKAVERGGDETLLQRLRVQRAEEFDKPLPGTTNARKAA